MRERGRGAERPERYRYGRAQSHARTRGPKYDATRSKLSRSLMVSIGGLALVKKERLVQEVKAVTAISRRPWCKDEEAPYLGALRQ